MYDVLAVYAKPSNTTEFLNYFKSVHALKVQAMPGLAEFTWGIVDIEDGDPYLIARMTYHSEAAAVASLESEPGREAVADLSRFAQAGVSIYNVPRSDMRD